MKNLKDEIEGILNYHEMTGSYISGAKRVDYKHYDENAKQHIVQALTSLIEQEKERAGREILDKFVSWVILNKHDLEIAHDLVEYLAERKG